MKVRSLIIPGILVLIVLPIFLTPLIFFIAEWVIVKNFGDAWNGTWDKLTSLSLMEHISLNSAVTGTLVIICFPFVFRKLLKKDNENIKQEEFNRRKQILHDVLNQGIFESMKIMEGKQSEYFHSNPVTDKQINMITEVDSLFSGNQILLLQQVIERLKQISQQVNNNKETEAKKLIEDLKKIVVTPNYVKQSLQVHSKSDMDQWLNEEIRTIIQILSDKTNKENLKTNANYSDQVN